MPNSEAAVLVLLYFILPLWLAAGFADYLCHRASSIELTTGYKETLIHLLMFSEVAVPLLAAIFFRDQRSRYRAYDRRFRRASIDRAVGCEFCD
jgi:hypothetical protein